MKKLILLALLSITGAFFLVSCRSKSAAAVISSEVSVYSPAFPNDYKPDVREVLERTLGQLDKIHTAVYDITKRIYSSESDSGYISRSTARIIECENPIDTFGNAKMVILKENGSFSFAYDGTYAYHDMPEGLYINTPGRLNSGIVYVLPPFFNHARNVAEYLLTPNKEIRMILSDDNNNWVVKAEIYGESSIIFLGKPSRFRTYMNPVTRYLMRVDKSTMLPVQLDYTLDYPVRREIQDCNNVALNPFDPEAFDVTDYLPAAPHNLGSTDDSKSAETRNSHFEALKGQNVPNDTLTESTGRKFTLNDYQGHPVLLMLTMDRCGACMLSYPTINKLAADYAPSGLEVIAVMIEDTAEIAAIAAYKKNHNIGFHLARDNGNVHRHFSLTGVSPTFAIIDRDGTIRHVWSGFSVFSDEAIAKEESKIRKLIEQSL